MEASDAELINIKYQVSKYCVSSLALTLWRRLLPCGYGYKASYARPG